MLLVDSSIWIDQLLDRETDGVQFVSQRDEIEDVCVTGAIVQEVLQGARTDADFIRYRDILANCMMLDPHERSTYELAAQLYRRCRKAGITIRSPNDCLIAAVALESDALIVHNDRDFFALAAMEPALQVYPRRH
jgi:predicted nucleic acid-binding protein